MHVANYHALNGRVRGQSVASPGLPDAPTGYLSDALGSVTGAVAADGGETEYRHKPYGERLSQYGPGPDPAFLWAGAWGYRATGLPHAERYVRARHYASRSGRWTSVDPMWPGESAYGYVGGNPTVGVDPSGLYPINVEYRAFIGAAEKGVFVSGCNGYSFGGGWIATPTAPQFQSDNYLYFRGDRREFGQDWRNTRTSRLRWSLQFDPSSGLRYFAIDTSYSEGLHQNRSIADLVPFGWAGGGNCLYWSQQKSVLTKSVMSDRWYFSNRWENLDNEYVLGVSLKGANPHIIGAPSIYGEAWFSYDTPSRNDPSPSGCKLRIRFVHTRYPWHEMLITSPAWSKSISLRFEPAHGTVKYNLFWTKEDDYVFRIPCDRKCSSLGSY